MLQLFAAVFKEELIDLKFGCNEVGCASTCNFMVLGNERCFAYCTFLTVIVKGYGVRSPFYFMSCVTVRQFLILPC